ncbi:helix-turn-helix domain-containing protein [Kitasatospora sp. RG8]|uniref:helix-turn-helix domain-containing protein n=1 Tax=Kitasatospora sp. RG8 TaxID=2820815 RepID=UPI001AE05B29|nr:helix-turn-helix domain-containing protein [Kitasatospora sp. RG8]MBP0453456.1 helix-turn-helix domain-containing protein [Kitasatospora sp. RG8]
MSTAVPIAMTVPEVMAALRISRSKVYDLIRSREIPSFTVGTRRRFDAADVAAYMRKRIEENY